MYYVITDSGMITGRNLAEINRKLNCKFELDEFTPVGIDKVCKVTDKDIDFLTDKKRMSKIFFGNFFKEDKSQKLICLMTLIFTLILLLVINSKFSTLFAGLEGVLIK